MATDDGELQEWQDAEVIAQLRSATLNFAFRLPGIGILLLTEFGVIVNERDALFIHGRLCLASTRSRCSHRG